jgi:CHRD domain
MDRPHSRIIDGSRRPRALMLAVALIVAVATVPVATASARGGPPAPTPPATAGLPPDWPADVPLPAGQIQGSTGGNGSWTVELLVNTGAAQAHKAAVDFYVGRGFKAETDSIVSNGTRRITIVVENRDHSPSQTFLLIAVTTIAGGANSGRVPLAARLAGHGRGSATVTISGARVCWTIRNLRGVAHPTGVTLRQGTAGRTGPVLARLGRRYRASGCTAIAAALGRSIAARPGGFYVAVATRAHPAGAVRGQLRPA